MLFKGAFVELFQAEGTDKMLWVKLLGHGCDAAPRDGLLAAGAEGAAALVVVHFTVGLAIVLKKASIHKWGEALLQKHTHTRYYFSTLFLTRHANYYRKVPD